MKRIAPLFGLLLGILLLTAGPVQAHQGVIDIQCTPTGANVTFNWQNFPRQFNVVNADVTLDTVTVAGSGKASFNGPAGSKTIPVQVPADGQPHTISAVTTWQQDNGGRAVKTATCTVPVPPQPPTPPTPPTCGTTVTCPPQVIIREVTHEVVREVPVEKVCTSRRVIEFKVRRRYPGVANAQGALVTGIKSAETLSLRGADLNGSARGDGRTTFRKTGGRWVVRVDLRGVVFSGFDNDTRTTVVVRTERGNRRLIYKAAQCRAVQGNPNDENARSPEIPVR